MAAKRRNGLDPETCARWPLQMASYAYGWTVTVYNQDGHVRHLASATSEAEAFRLARRMARLYHIQGEMLVRSGTDMRRYPIQKLLA